MSSAKTLLRLDLASDEEAEADEGEGEDEVEPPEGEEEEQGPQGAAAMGSRILARVAEGKQMDLGALKTEIQDDASLLGSWRKAPLGLRERL